ncbi:hypothetical protein M433DRAFT_149657 [Acidomyces richmondensis BFW]|nr:MAG: hypothetical protein FE78DRAFT_91385 [Acidomyces sp. 'richmondensis']KYG49805.1 hypothetical protein M433DRAFT_149657 [Acidomyces richmondensis BFW]
MAQPGESADYYNNDSNALGGQKEYSQQQQAPYASAPRYGGQQHMAPPPTFQQEFGQWQEKPTFDQAFKVDKPKWNDWWAGLLLLAVFGGFVAVSGISLQGYAATKGFNGGGIYGSSNDFGLDTNTIILFVFVMCIAIVLGYAYIALARVFTRQFICAYPSPLFYVPVPECNSKR